MAFNGRWSFRYPKQKFNGGVHPAPNRDAALQNFIAWTVRPCLRLDGVRFRMQNNLADLLAGIFLPSDVAPGDLPSTQNERPAATNGSGLWSLDNNWAFALGKAGDLDRNRYLLKADGFTHRDFANVKATSVRLPHDRAVDLQRFIGHSLLEPSTAPIEREEKQMQLHCE
jgi:hypothetical protein